MRHRPNTRRPSPVQRRAARQQHTGAAARLRRWLGAVLLAAGVALVAVSASPQQVWADDAPSGLSIEDVEDQGVQGLKAIFTVAQPRSVVFETLNDLDGFTRLFPNVLELKVLKTKGNTRDVYFKVDAVLAEAEYVLRRKHVQGEVRDLITWDRLRGDANVIRGAWILVDGDTANTTRVIYRSYVDVAMMVPTSTIRSIARGKIKEMVDRVRSASAKRAAKAAKPAKADTPSTQP